MTKNRRNRQRGSKPEEVISLEEISRRKQELDLLEQKEIQKALLSTDVTSIMKAQTYLSNLEARNNSSSEVKSYLFSPDLEYYNSSGYRSPIKSVSFETLRRMSRTPIIRIIIGTRVDQVAAFSELSSSEQEKGWMIRKKKTRHEKNATEDRKTVEYIEKFINNGGVGISKYDFDGFDQMLRALTLDSLTVDQACLECIDTRSGKIGRYVPVDATTIRLVDSSGELTSSLPKKMGMSPRFAQVYMDNVYTYFYPWEMSFGVRNKTTDVFSNGYGLSELEDLVQIVTYILFGTQYNGNFFSQGSNPKGFFSIEGSVTPNALSDFKQMWRNTIAGVQNSHKVPVIESGGAKVNWVDMQSTNKDMEFDLWLDFLITICCCIFKIDPVECGFNLNKANNVFGQDGQKARLKHSQSKGLTPILKMLQRLFTKYIVERIDEDYEFVFTGVEQEDQIAALDMDVKKAASGFMSLEDGFEKYSGRKFNPETDTILNSVYAGIQQQKQMGGDTMNSLVDSESEGAEINPFEKALLMTLNGEGLKKEIISKT